MKAVVTSNREQSFTLKSVQSLLLGRESRIHQEQSSSTKRFMAANILDSGKNFSGRDHGSSFGRGRGIGWPQQGNSSKLICQICQKGATCV